MPPVIAFDADVLGRRRTGDETVTRSILGALGGLDLPFRVLAYVRDPREVPERATASGVVVPVRVDAGSNYLRGALALPARLQTDRPALYHGLYLLPPGLPCPAVVTVADASFLRTGAYMPRIDRAAFKRFVPWSARRATRVVTPSEHARADLLELVPDLDPAAVVALSWGVAAADFHPVFGAAERVARRFGIDRPYALFLGALQPRKNLLRLLEAWVIRRVRAPEREELLVLAGAPRTPGDDLDDAVERLGISASVRRLGYVEGQDGLRDLIVGARFLAFPSLYEGFGLPVLEAMACGTPVLAADATALPETAGGAALLVDPLAPAAMAEGLGRLLDDDEEHARLRAAGLARASGATWARTAERLADVWCDVLGGTGPRPRRSAAEASARSAAPVLPPPAAAALVTASVVSTGEADRLRPCLTALEAQGLGDGLRVVVVCNSPGDGSAELVRAAFPSVTVVEQPERRGFAENHNTGLAACPSRFGLILNPDVLLDPGCLRALLTAAEADPRCGLVVPALVYPDGRPQPSARRFPTPLGTLLRRTPLRRLLPPDRFAARHYLAVPTEDREIDWALGACLLVRRDAWDELGGFDEGFRPLYVEDIDLAWRMRRAGWSVRQAAAAVARHEHQAATDTVFLTRRTLWHARGMARFVRRHPMVLLAYRPGLGAGRR